MLNFDPTKIECPKNKMSTQQNEKLKTFQ